jgi:hypothetical protein
MGLSEIVSSVWDRLPWTEYKYSAIPVPLEPRQAESRADIWSAQNRKLLKISMVTMISLVILYLVIAFS